MGIYFAKDYTGDPFTLFSSTHLIALLLIFLINLSFLLIKRKTTENQRKAIRYIMAAILVINELSWHAWNYAIGKWTYQEMLPFHLCSVFVWLSAYMLVKKDGNIYEFAYFLGLGGALQNLITPDIGIYGFPHFRFFQGFISHGMIVTASLYMTIVEGYRPYWKSIPRVIAGGMLYMAVIFIFNLLTGSNYLFIAHKPETASLMDFLGPWPWYILPLIGVGLLNCLILYTPFAIKDWVTSTKLKREPAT